jgi:hypothetical protein
LHLVWLGRLAKFSLYAGEAFVNAGKRFPDLCFDDPNPGFMVRDFSGVL